ncbi:hypothetical protein M378DRAFT_155982 [Amanita muscaria Koide BX008]|uniref:Uncharacterized protein n=1 Tax=Amanita muscaria (strain Koide BX008) TaxID=946122 RepID=A0A0C2XPE5_AMAMK|nr:hypothetical protein M378DRAFT_155982 [Amanita muscaria Koide BX008]
MCRLLIRFGDLSLSSLSHTLPLYIHIHSSFKFAGQSCVMLADHLPIEWVPPSPRLTLLEAFSLTGTI